MPSRKRSQRVVVSVEFSAIAREHDDGWLRAIASTNVGEIVQVDNVPSRRLIAFADSAAAEAFCAAVTHDGRFDLVPSAPEIPVARTEEMPIDPAVSRH